MSYDSDIHDDADGIMVGKLSGHPNQEAGVDASGSDEGFIIFDIHGKVLKHAWWGITKAQV